MIRLPDPKNRRPHKVKLTEDAVRLIKTLPRTFGSEWVFPGKDPSKPMCNPYKAWKRVCERAEITGLRMHDLRRSYASWLINNGVSLEVVGQMLNHKSLETTRKVYAQVSDTAKKEAVKTLASVVPLRVVRN